MMSYEPVVLGIVAAPHSSAAPQCRSSLTTFHPDPTGHDRGCPSSVPTVRLAEDGSVTCLDTSLVRMRTPRLDNNQGGIAEPQLYGHLDTIRAPARGYSPRESSQLPIADSVTLCCDASPSCDADNNSQHSFLPAVCTPVITSALTVPWSPHDSLRCVDRPRPDMAADSRPVGHCEVAIPLAGTDTMLRGWRCREPCLDGILFYMSFSLVCGTQHMPCLSSVL